MKYFSKIDAKNFNAAYSLGAIHVNLSNYYTTAIRNSDPKMSKETRKSLESDYNKYVELGLGFLLDAEKIDANDIGLVRGLKEVYSRKSDNANWEKYSDREKRVLKGEKFTASNPSNIQNLLNQEKNTVVITMKKVGGVYSVPCKVNGLEKWDFIFDTGASNVIISLTEAIYMLKHNYLKKEDIIGVTNSQIADGSIVENTKIILREIEFGGIKLQNIEALVSNNINSPLLLGQSAMEKLGEITFNPSKATLTIKLK